MQLPYFVSRLPIYDRIHKQIVGKDQSQLNLNQLDCTISRIFLNPKWTTKFNVLLTSHLKPVMAIFLWCLHKLEII